MASTPEARVKKQVKELLKTYGEALDSYWPVPSGYGESHLDCIVCFYGVFIAIETKAPGKGLRALQRDRIRRVHNANGYALVIGGPDQTHTLRELQELLDAIKEKEGTYATGSGQLQAQDAWHR